MHAKPQFYLNCILLITITRITITGVIAGFNRTPLSHHRFHFRKLHSVYTHHLLFASFRSKAAHIKFRRVIFNESSILNIQITHSIQRSLLNMQHTLATRHYQHDAWQMILDIIMCITFIPVQNIICQNFEKKPGLLIIKRYK